MVVDGDRVDAVFRALADATRRDIVLRVLEEEHSVTELARGYDMSFAAVQKHVALLERAELVSKRRAGREVRVRGNVIALRLATDLLTRMESVWRDRFDRIAELVENPNKMEEP